MAKSTPIRNNFNAGELSPKIDWRGDVAKYHSGCRTLQNMVPLVEGGVTRMPGTYFVKEVKDSSKATRVVRFSHNGQAYCLEFGEYYFRVYKNNAQLLDGGSPVEIVNPYAEAHIFAVKINVQSTDVLYQFHPNYEPLRLTRVSDTEWLTGAIAFRPPPTRQLGHKPVATLTLSAVKGSGITFTASAADSFIRGDVGREIQSQLGRATIVGYTSDTIVTCNISEDFSSVGPIASQEWTILSSPFPGIRSSNLVKGDTGALSGIDADGFSGHRDLHTYLIGLHTTTVAWLLSTGGGTAEYYSPDLSEVHTTEPVDVIVAGVTFVKGILGSLAAGEWGFGDNDGIGQSVIYIRTLTDVNPNVIESVLRFDVEVTEIFRAEDVGKYIYMNGGLLKILSVASSSSATAEVMEDLLDTDSYSWRMEQDLWSDDLGWPATGYFFEQRLGMAGSTSFPNAIALSVSAQPENFFRDVEVDDASIEFALVADQVEQINWMAGVDFLMLGTSSSLWKLGASSSGEPITQTNVSTRRQVSSGTKNIHPLQVPDSIIWVNLFGQAIYRLDYNFELDKYVPTNMTRLASHITKGATQTLSGVVEMAFQHSPIPIVWAVRADGQLLGMTYETQEEMYSWFRIVTDGFFESVTVLKGADQEDQIWVVVRRVINGATVRYVEYFKPMELFSKIEDSFFVHSGVTFDGGDDMTITGITQGNPALVTAANTLVGGEKIRIADVEGMSDANTGRTKAWTVANPTANSFELSGITSVGWDAYTSGGTATVVQKDFTSGLDHLLNETLDIVVDGAALPQKQFTGYPFSLSYYGNKVHMGLPAISILNPTQPYLDTQQGVSRGNKQRISSVLVSFYETYGAKVGKDLDNLKPMKFGTGAQPELFTGEVKQPFDGDWGNESDLFIVQDKPLPMTVRAIKYGLSHNEDD